MTKENQTKNKSTLSTSAKSFILSLSVIFGLMIVAYILSFVIPGGMYERIIDENGYEIIDTSKPFTFVSGGISFVKWLFSPFLVLGANGSGLLIGIIIFLLVIGGIFKALEKCGLLEYMLSVISNKFAKSRYKFMAVIIFFFMAMGSLIGSFEEIVPLIPLVVAISVALGWDVITGFAISLLSAGCGFAAGVFNPFSVGVAQKLAKIPMFSGFWLRAVAFVLIYLLLLTFVILHAKKIERPVNNTLNTFVKNEKLSKGLIAFGTILGTGILIVISSVFITAIQDFTIYIIAIMFLVAGLSSTFISGMKPINVLRSFLNGVLEMLPAVLMILMASSIKFILEESCVLDTILNYAITFVENNNLSNALIILFIYLLVLIMNFFVASGSAKAFMIIPLIVPLATHFGISPQLCVMAYAFGDGFSNVFYPTNAALLLGLNIGGLSYGKWAKWSVKFQLCNLLLTSALLLFGLAVGYV